jgi:hypothetical protein
VHIRGQLRVEVRAVPILGADYREQRVMAFLGLVRAVPILGADYRFDGAAR